MARAWVEENLDNIVENGLYMSPDPPMEIEVWTALADFLHIPPELVADIRADPSYSCRYNPAKHLVVLKLHAAVMGISVPEGRTQEEMEKVIEGAREYLLLRAWHKRVIADNPELFAASMGPPVGLARAQA